MASDARRIPIERLLAQCYAADLVSLRWWLQCNQPGAETVDWHIPDGGRVFDTAQQQQRANAELQHAEPQLRGVPHVGGIQPAMKRFNPAAGCPKCGSLQRDLEWKKADRISALYAGPAEVIPEKLIVRCRLCGFVDTFTPLDGPAS